MCYDHLDNVDPIRLPIGRPIGLPCGLVAVPDDLAVAIRLDSGVWHALAGLSTLRTFAGGVRGALSSPNKSISEMVLPGDRGVIGPNGVLAKRSWEISETELSGVLRGAFSLIGVCGIPSRQKSDMELPGVPRGVIGRCGFIGVCGKLSRQNNELELPGVPCGFFGPVGVRGKLSRQNTELELSGVP